MTSREERKRQLGQQIRLLRDTRGLTVEQAVAMAEDGYGLRIHSNTWGNVENGKGGAGRTFAAIEMVLRLERGACKRYIDHGGEAPGVVDAELLDAPLATPQQMADAINRASDDDLYNAGIERHEIAVVRAVAEKIARQGVPGESKAQRASG